MVTSRCGHYVQEMAKCHIWNDLTQISRHNGKWVTLSVIVSEMHECHPFRSLEDNVSRKAVTVVDFQHYTICNFLLCVILPSTASLKQKRTYFGLQKRIPRFYKLGVFIFIFPNDRLMFIIWNKYRCFHIPKMVYLSDSKSGCPGQTEVHII